MYIKGSAVSNFFIAVQHPQLLLFIAITSICSVPQTSAQYLQVPIFCHSYQGRLNLAERWRPQVPCHGYQVIQEMLMGSI